MLCLIIRAIPGRLRNEAISSLFVVALMVLSAHASAVEILIGPGEEVRVTSTDGPAVAIDTNGTDDTVTNQGTVGAEALDQEAATAAAIRTGVGNDRVDNEGSIDAAANASGRSAAASAAGIETGADDDVVLNIPGVSTSILVDAESTGTPGLVVIVPGADASSTAQAQATGVAAGTGEDTVSSLDVITAHALARSGAGKITIPIGAGGNADSTAVSVATGLDGGEGSDSLVSGGLLTTEGESHAGAGEIAVGAAAGARGDALTTANATARGMVAGSGDDEVRNDAEMITLGTATAGGGSISVTGEEASIGEVSSVAQALAVGIEGGQGIDDIRSIGVTRTVADANAGAGTLSVNLKGNATGNAAIDARADAVGIDGGADTDTIVVAPVSSVVSIATATSGGGTVGVVVGGRIDGEVSSTAAATAKGIDGQDGGDTVANAGKVAATASATSGSGTIGVAVGPDGGGAPDPDATGSAAGDAKSIATATALGVSGSEFTNTGTLSAESAATTGAGSIQVNVAGDASGDATTSATAAATAVAGTAGADTLRNRLDAPAAAIAATASAISAGGSVTVARDGSAGGDASNTASATAKAIDGQGGDDTVENAGTLASSATATSGGGTIGVAVESDGVAGDGMDKSKSEGDAKSTATATALGVSGGDVTNTGSVSSDATATTGSGSVQVNVAGSASGSAATTAEADAAGILGTSKNDALRNRLDAPDAEVLSTATATAGGGSVKVALDGNAAGDVSSTASATARGIDGQGGDDDVVENAGTVAAKAVATSGAGTIGVAVEKSDTENAADGADSSQSAEGKATSNATAIAKGLDGSRVANTGSVTADAQATTGSGSVEVNVGGGAKADASTKAAATADAIRGASGGGGLHGNVTANAEARAGSASIAVGVGGSVAGDVTSTADARAAGIVSSKAGGKLDNAATIATTAVADSAAGSLRVATPKPDAGGGDPVPIVADSASSSALDKLLAKLDKYVSTVKGTAASESKASATGLAGNTADDKITSSGSIVSDADATAAAASITVNVSKIEEKAGASASLVQVGATADATAKAVDAGDGDDDLAHTGDVIANANAVAVGTDVTADIVVEAEKVAVGAALVDSSVNAGSTARGVTGGTGVDQLRNEGKVDALAKSTALGVAASLTVTNLKDARGGSAALSRSTVDAHATSYGLDGGEETTPGGGIAAIHNEGDVNSKAQADATGVSASVDVTVTEKDVAVSASLAQSNVDAKADSAAIRGSAGGDDIRQRGRVDSQSDANATAVSVGVGVSVTMENGLAASAALTDATSSAEASAAGITSGAGDDVISQPVPDAAGGGDADWIRARATATGEAAAVPISVAYDGESGAALSGALARADSTSRASAVGIDAGAGDDVALREPGPSPGGGGAPGPGDPEPGAIDVAASASGVATSVGVAVAGTGEQGFAGGATLSQATTTADSEGAGIAMGDGSDEVVNRGDISVDTHAKVTATGVTVNVDVANEGAAIGAALSDTRVLAQSDALGISAGDGDDAITQTGAIALQSAADSVAVSAAVALAGTAEGLAGDAALSRSSGTADATSFGVDAGAGNDAIEQGGAISASVIADVTTVSVSTDVSIASEGVAIGASLSDARSAAHALAGGVAGGEGDDDVSHSGDIDLTSKASAVTTSVSVDVAGSAEGLSAGAALAEAGAEADAHAVGSAGGAGRDRTSNDGAISVTTNATAVAASVTAKLGIATEGVAAGVSLADTSATSASTSTGIAGDDGDDMITDDGDVSVIAMSHTDTAAVSVDVEGSAEGAGGAVSLSRASGSADATAVGLDGGDGNDVMTHEGKLLATAIADVVDVSTSVALSVASEGAAIGVSLSQASSNSHALASGSRGGTGNDLIDHAGDVGLISRANASTVSVSVGVQGTAAGLSAGAALADVAGTADAHAVGASGGTGADRIDNAGTIRAEEVAATTSSTAVSVDLAIAGEGVGVGVAMADSQATAKAAAVGLAGDEDDDTLTNSGDVVFDKVTSDATAVSTSISLSGGEGGVFLSASLVDGNATSETSATGLDGGTGDDTILNAGAIRTTAPGSPTDRAPISAHAQAAGVSVGFSGTGEGLTGSASLARTGASARTTVAGIDAGEGSDRIANEGAIVLDVESEAKAQSIGVSATLTVAGVALGAALTDASTEAQTRLAGVDAGAGDDRITNDDSVDLRANTMSNGVAVSAVVPAAVVGVGTALARTTNDADGDVVGLDGGAGNDLVENRGALLKTEAISQARGTSISANLGLAGLSMGATTNTSTATTGGIRGGQGDDLIRNEAGIESTARSTAEGLSLALTLGVGASLGDATSTATARAAGISAGDGDDAIGHGGDDAIPAIRSTAQATAGADALSIVNVGVGGARTATTADAAATGIDGGAGRDRIDIAATGAGAGDAGEIHATATATGKARSMSLTFLSLAAADASSTATAEARGIDGGADGDTIAVGDGLASGADASKVDATATATGTAGGVDLALGGAGKADASTSAHSSASGVDGGGGDDTIEFNELADISAAANATGKVTATGIRLEGAEDATAATDLDAHARGVAGGDGADSVSSRGNVKALANATGTVTSVNLGVSGLGRADASTTATATASAIDGGAGDDTIGIDSPGDISANATVSGTLKSTSMRLAGASVASASTLLGAVARGVAAGDGADVVEVDGKVDATSSTTSVIENQTFTLLGVTSNSADAITSADSIGVSGGKGDDSIVTRDDLSASATVSSRSDQSNWSFVHAGDDVKLTSMSSGTGLSGGSGNDDVRNEGDVEILSDAELHATGKSDSLLAFFDGAKTGAEISAEVGAVGIDGGDDDDAIENVGSLDVTSAARLHSRDVRVVFVADSPVTNELLQSESRAVGIAGGDGRDDIRNSGDIAVQATSFARSEGGTSAGASGNPEVAGRIATNVDAVGIEASPVAAGGGASDAVANTGSLSVSARVELLGTHDSSAGFFSGGGATETDVRAAVRGDGVRAADGRVDLENTEQIRVSTSTTDGESNPSGLPESVLARATASGGDFSAGGNARAKSVADVSVDLAGVLAGDGDSQVVNAPGASIVVETAASEGFHVLARSTSDGSTVDAGSDGTGTSSASVKSTLAGIRAGDGASTLTTGSGSTLTVVARPVADASTTARGGTVGVGSDGTATTHAATEARLLGISTGNGAGTIGNAGAVSVTAAPQSRAAGLGKGGLIGTGSHTATASANGVEAVGIGAGAGAASIENSGAVATTAAPLARSGGSAGGGSLSGSAVHRSTARANAAAAVGIRTGDGASEIANSGSIHATSRPEADATASADGTSGGGATARATAEANDALAVGILTDGGAGHSIRNEGDITALAAPKVSASASASPGGVCIGSCKDESAVTQALRTRAFGVLTGVGDDEVQNLGSIVAQVGGSAALTGAGAASVTGIDTGAGNDVVVNDGSGSISAEFTGPGSAPVAVAIRTGAGADVVALRGQSKVVGLIDLGNDADTLSLAGAATLTGTLEAGAGVDTVQIEDRGRFLLLRIDNNENYFVDQGTLEVGTETNLPSDDSLRVEIFNGGHGLMELPGTARLLSNPQADVVVRARAFRDGETFDLFTATDIVGEFDAVLPADSALVSFSSRIRRESSARDAFEVSTAVGSFASVAKNPLQSAVAGYLEDITPTATGDLSEVIGTFQLLPADADFDTAFTSLSPDTHDNYTVATDSTVSLFQEVLGRRMRAVRLSELFGSESGQIARLDSARSPLQLAYNDIGDNARAFYVGEDVTIPKWWRNFWATAYGRKGDQDSEDGYTGFDYTVVGAALGFDRRLNDQVLLGASLAYSYTDIEQKNNAGDGDIKGLIGSLYGSYSLEKFYLDGALSYGRNSYSGTRNVRIGSLNRVAESDHDGSVAAATLGVGYLAFQNETVLEPYGLLQYIYLDEDSFTESGAGSVNQTVADRDTESLVSELGVRVTRAFEKTYGRLTADASVGWLHDFDIDDRVITTNYTGAPTSSFSIPGQDVERNGLALGFGVGFETKEGLSTSLSYRGQFRDGFSAHGITGQINYRF